MKGWIFFFAFLGALSVLSGISGISSFTADLGGTAVTRDPDTFSRCIAVCQGSLLLFFAWAIYRKIRWIWRLMFFFFGFVWAESIVITYGVVSRENIGRENNDTLIGSGLTGLAMAAVGIYWGYRWYKQREYFIPDKKTG